MRTGNLVRWLEEARQGEEIEAVAMESETPGDGVLLSWEEAKEKLDYDFDNGYGGVGCEAITAWTATRVFFLVQYDGTVGLYSVPRHPVAKEPEMPGG